MIVGFTGTRDGMTEAQSVTVWLLTTLAHHVRHGDCVGADAQMDEMAAERGQLRTAHPPTDPRLQAHCATEQRQPAKPYLDRNRDIVDKSWFIVAAPRESTEQEQGGTWYTVRYARATRKLGLIVWPDGSTSRLSGRPSTGPRSAAIGDPLDPPIRTKELA